MSPLPLLALVLAVLAAPPAWAGATAPASSRPAGAAPGARPPALGISDQKPDTFTDPRFRALRLRHARLVVPWDAVFTTPALLDGWLRAARAARARPLLAFGAGVDQRCPHDPCLRPRPDELVTAFDAIRAAYPWVTQFQVWNEANHLSQPFASHPAQAAALWDALARRCSACTVVAADVLGDRSMLGWVRRFRRAARVPARLWGLHNYADTNDGGSRATRGLLRAVPGHVWFTETGGIVRFRTLDGRLLRPHDEQRAARGIHRSLDLAWQHARRVRRVYLFHWRAGPPTDRFDAGVVGPRGEERPGLRALWRRVNGTMPLPAAPASLPAPPPAKLRRVRAPAIIASTGVRRPRGWLAVVKVRCISGRGPCRGAVTLTERRLGWLGTGGFTLRGGESRAVRVAVGRRAAGRLQRRRLGTQIRAAVRLRLPSGAVASAVRRLRLQRRSPRHEAPPVPPLPPRARLR